jgi:hypothetical protein
MSRARLLSGLTVDQVSVRPPGLPHTIYDELWHTTKWQSDHALQENHEGQPNPPFRRRRLLLNAEVLGHVVRLADGRGDSED